MAERHPSDTRLNPIVAASDNAAREFFKHNPPTAIGWIFIKDLGTIAVRECGVGIYLLRDNRTSLAEDFFQMFNGQSHEIWENAVRTSLR